MNDENITSSEIECIRNKLLNADSPSGFGIKDYSALTDLSCTLNLPPSLGRACAATEEAVLCFLNVRKQFGNDFPQNVISLLSQLFEYTNSTLALYMKMIPADSDLAIRLRVFDCFVRHVCYPFSFFSKTLECDDVALLNKSIIASSEYFSLLQNDIIFFNKIKETILQKCDLGFTIARNKFNSIKNEITGALAEKDKERFQMAYHYFSVRYRQAWEKYVPKSRMHTSSKPKNI